MAEFKAISKIFCISAYDKMELAFSIVFDNQIIDVYLLAN